VIGCCCGTASHHQGEIHGIGIDRRTCKTRVRSIHDGHHCQVSRDIYCDSAVIECAHNTHTDPIKLRTAWEARALENLDVEMEKPLFSIPNYEAALIEVLESIGVEIQCAAEAI
jgi:hypothetical protein